MNERANLPTIAQGSNRGTLFAMDESDSILSASEIIKDRLYFVTFKTSAKPKNTHHSHYFSTDEKFVYESFYWDFGPLNICHVYNYCELVKAKLAVTVFGKRKIIHYTSASPQKRLNAAFLAGAYAIIKLKKTADEAYAMLTRGDPPPFMKFRDASNITPVFEINLHDCLAGLEKALKYRFFDIGDFYVDEYEYWERVEYGDLNWIVPGKFLAMCGPHRVAGVVKGYPQHAPDSYFDYFRKHDVMHVVRLNCRSYDAKQFTDKGFQHLELFFPDGSCPNDAIMQQFLQYCEQTKHAVAVHCKAGLGRTGSLIGAYMVKHYKFSAMEAIAWLRLCRPGSVIGHQQRWLEEKQEQLWAEGDKYRKKHNISEPPLAECGIYSYFAEEVARDKLAGISKQVNNISLNDKTVSQDMANNNTSSNSDSNNNAEVDDEGQADKVDGHRAHSEAAEEVKSRSFTGRVTRSSSATPKVPPRRARMTITTNNAKTQGDELNEIKATRRRHTRSHNLDNANNKHNLNADPTAPTTAVLQRFVAKITRAKDAPVSAAATTTTTTSGSVEGSPLRRARVFRIVSGEKPTSTTTGTTSSSSQSTTTTTSAGATTGTTGVSGGSSATVIAKNMRNTAGQLDSANNNSNGAAASGALSSKTRNKRSIHERENNTAAASKISRRYASTTMAVQQKQKEPVHTSTLVVKKVMITPATINSKTYPGPKRSSAF